MNRPRTSALIVASAAALAALAVVLLLGLALLSVRGQVAVIAGDATNALVWPRVALESSDGRFTVVSLTDVRDRAYLALMADGQHVEVLDWQKNPGSTPTWTWRWRFPPLRSESYELRFYHSCNEGCVEWTRVHIGPLTTSVADRIERIPTKLGVVFANPERDWHNRAGWAVDLAYAAQEHDGYTVDDLAERAYRNHRLGLRTLVRVDFDKGQSLPPAGDYVALETYLRYLTRLARDDRLREVYAFIIGSGFNADDGNANAAQRKVTPEWYARVFNGYGEAVQNTRNVVQAMRAANPLVRILVGPVRPWVTDQNGPRKHETNAPWLNYMNTLVAAIDESARAKAVAGIPLAAPDGFAINAPGRPDAPELTASQAAREPLTDLKRAEWNGAQAGFRVYRDWLAIINAYPTTRGLPVYINSTNTAPPDQKTPPMQNYPKGWLTNALNAINDEPQVQALCWFMDALPGDPTWDAYSLSGQQGKLAEAADEFDALLHR